MPTVVIVDGYQVQVYTRNEHLPAHVHVVNNGSVMKIQLHVDAAEYHSYKGATPNLSQVRRATEIVAENLGACWTVWRKFHE